MEQLESEVNLLQNLKDRFCAAEPESIREKVTAWAFEDAEDAAAILRCLEGIDCAACFSPAPIYYHDMAQEVAEHWAEIDEALDRYRDEIGEPWTPRRDQNFLTFLWFAYEWTASGLADEIRAAIEAAE